MTLFTTLKEDKKGRKIMYDINRRKSFRTAGELFNMLRNIPDDTEIAICGDSNCWFHIEEDNSIICLDCEDLEECYDNE